MNKTTKMMMMSNRGNRGRENDREYYRRNYNQMEDYENGHYSRRDGRYEHDNRGRYMDNHNGYFDVNRERREPRGNRARHYRNEWEDPEDWEDKPEYNPKQWISEMVNSDGSKGAHWSIEDTEAARKNRGINDCDPEDFWVTMNMMYSDYFPVAKKFGVDKPELYAEMAKAFLCDKDSKQGREKLEAYYCYVVK